MADRNSPAVCDACGSPANRAVGAERVGSMNHEFNKPIEMYSVAPNSADEVTELRRAVPDIKFNDQLVPLAHNRAEKLRILKAVGYAEKS